MRASHRRGILESRKGDTVMLLSRIRRLLFAGFALALVLPVSALAKLVPQDSVAPVTTAATGGFDWADAAVGLGVGIVATIVLIGGVEYARHHLPHGPAGRPTHGAV